MGKFDENYFKPGSDKQFNTIDEIIDHENNEEILWRGKPKKKAYVTNACLKMLPIAIIWIIFDSFVIGMSFGNFPSAYTVFIIIFMLVHLMPVWIWIGNIVTANRQHRNLEYAFTNKRIILKSGIIGINIKSVYYSEISNINLKVNVIDKMLKVGDIYINSISGADVLYDIENPYFITERLQKIVIDIKSDMKFPNNLRPEENSGYNTKYRP